MVIEFRCKNVGGCQDNACYGYIRIMQDELIALGGFQGNAGCNMYLYRIVVRSNNKMFVLCFYTLTFMLISRMKLALFIQVLQ
jgi:hypothetical protein